MLKTIIVDKHAGYREALKEFLSRHNTIEIIGEAANIDDAHSLVSRRPPDIIIIDCELLNMPQEYIKLFSKNNPVFILTTTCDMSLNPDLFEDVRSFIINKESLFEDLPRVLSESSAFDGKNREGGRHENKEYFQKT